MIIALRVEINAIAVCILIILLQNKRRTGKNLLDERLYQALLLASLFYAVFDSIAWILDGTQSPHMRVILYAVNILCYLLCVIVPYIWSLYAEFRLFENEEKLWKINRFFALPVALYSLLVIATPLTGWMFSFDNKQTYQRGPLFLLQVILTLLYIVYPTLRAVMRLKTATLAYERQECYNIGGFILFPLFGFFVQVIFYGMPAAIIATVVAELIIFINLQNKQISLDALTGLNNRGQLNRYLSIQTKKENRKENLYMLLLDIDRFKLINDTYGHRVGDLALIDMATVLQRACGKRGGFLSRCGGDEFAIITEKESHIEVEQLIQDIQTETKLLNESGKREYKLAISIGYAKFGTASTMTIDQLMEAADSKMYQMKVKNHNEFPAKIVISRSSLQT